MPAQPLNATSFRHWVRQQRRDCDLTQGELAAQAGCSVETIRKIEAGALRPSKHLAEVLATALAIAPAERPAFLRLARGQAAAVPPHGAGAQPGGPVAPRHNLPAPLTPFVGQVQTITRVQNLLWRADVRLLTLTGPPGTGKTRLAIEVGARLLADFADGVFLIPLAAVRDPDLVLATVARTLEVGDAADRPVAEGLAVALQGRRLLLLLDNFEQVLAAAPALVTLLLAVPTVKAVVTSREALRVRGEKIVPVPPLALPPAGAEAVPARLVPTDAVTLFVQRVQDVQIDFALTPATAPAVVAICRRLDGLPLALELAAAQLATLSLTELGAELEHGPALLDAGLRDLPVHQQTLRRTLAWSYDRLTPAEQRLFRRLGVFAGGFTAAAVAAVLGDPAPAPLRLLEALAGKSLVRRMADAAGEPRFTLLEPIRAYAFDQLEREGEAAAIQQVHAAYYRDLAESAAPAMGTAQQDAWFDQFEIEHDNFRHALAWALRGGDAATAVRLGAALGRFWCERRHFHAGRRWMDAILVLGAARPAALRPIWWAGALRWAGGLVYYLGDLDRARNLGEQSLAIYRRLGDSLETAAALNNLSNIAQDQGDFARARILLQESLDLYRATDQTWRFATALTNLGGLEADAGNFARAAQLQTDSLALFRALGAQRDALFCLICLGETALYKDDLVQARALLAESLDLSRALGDERLVAMTEADLGFLALAEGEGDRAAALLEESLARRWDLGEVRLLPGNLEGLAALAVAREQHAHAAWLLGVAGGLRTRLGMPVPPADPTHSRTTRATAEGAVDAAIFAAALAAGRATPLAQAVESLVAAVRPASPRIAATPAPIDAAEAAGPAERSAEAGAAGPEMPPQRVIDYVWSGPAVPAPAEAPAAVPQRPRPVSARQAAQQQFGGLTPREREVAVLIAQGKSNAEIAGTLVTSKRTVEKHVGNILSRLGFSSRAQIVAWVLARGLLSPRN
jgi:predicted ATPase/DNA-binding CsgD family transcriptional regulator/DNA-binding XRE family transcriptional regulator